MRRPRTGDWFIKVHHHGSDREYHTMHKLVVFGGKFEFGTLYKTMIGWGDVSDLKVNPDFTKGTSKVRWIQYEK